MPAYSTMFAAPRAVVRLLVCKVNRQQCHQCTRMKRSRDFKTDSEACVTSHLQMSINTAQSSSACWRPINRFYHRCKRFAAGMHMPQYMAACLAINNLTDT